MRMAAAVHEPPGLFRLPPSGAADWRDERAYLHLEGAEPPAFAWEWLRRNARYRSGYEASLARRSTDALHPPCQWGICAYADPDLEYGSARPLWHGSLYPLVLGVAASRGGEGEAINLARFIGGRMTIAAGSDGIEHCLFIGSGASLRFDMFEGSVTRGPFVPRFLLEGAAATGLLLPVLGQFLHLARSGELRPMPGPANWSRRRILELRARDALALGASHRDIAAGLIDEDARGPGWRAELPSVRSRAQRLVRAARTMEAGGWMTLLAGRRSGLGRAGRAMPVASACAPDPCAEKGRLRLCA